MNSAWDLIMKFFTTQLIFRSFSEELKYDYPVQKIPEKKEKFVSKIGNCKKREKNTPAHWVDATVWWYELNYVLFQFDRINPYNQFISALILWLIKEYKVHLTYVFIILKRNSIVFCNDMIVGNPNLRWLDKFMNLFCYGEQSQS